MSAQFRKTPVFAAVALAAALKAERCEIYTDVEGIYTADPRIVPEARVLAEIDYEEMLELAVSGAKMQPRSIELGELYDIPILVASTFSSSLLAFHSALRMVTTSPPVLSASVVKLHTVPVVVPKELTSSMRQKYVVSNAREPGSKLVPVWFVWNPGVGLVPK